MRTCVRRAGQPLVSERDRAASSGSTVRRWTHAIYVTRVTAASPGLQMIDAAENEMTYTIGAANVE